MKKLIITISLLFFLTAGTKAVEAAMPISQPSAQLQTLRFAKKKDYRIILLANFLKSQSSPMADQAQAMVKAADKYQLDWRLIPAIAGVESSFGKRMPQNSFNAYGWANGTYRFRSWEESFEVIARALRFKYINRGANSVSKIGKIYAPPSQSWSKRVSYLMKKINPLPLTFSLDQ